MTAVQKHKWNILFITSCSSMLIYFDISAIPVAIPGLEKELSLSIIDGLWVINSYLLALMAFFLVSGKLSDHFGKKPIFILGFACFGLGSIFGALSSTSSSLIVSRAIQGLGGALSFPTSSSILMEAFPSNERAKASGVNTGIGSMFLLAGPMIGGFFVQYLNWRYIFWINIPFVVYGLISSFFLLPHEKKSKKEFHIFGAILVMLASFCLVVPIMQGGEWGWSSPKVIGFFCLFFTFTLLFIYVSLQRKHQLIDFSLFRHIEFNVINLCIFIAQGVLTFNIFIAIYLQNQWSYSPIEAGQILLIASIPFVIFSPIGGYLSDHFHPKLPLIGGFIILIFSFLWFIFFQPSRTYFYFLPPLLFLSCSVALIRTPTFSYALNNVPSNHLGAAVSLIKGNRQLANTLGLALMTASIHSSYQKHSYQKGFFILVWIFIGVSVLGLLFSLLFIQLNKKYGKLK